MNKARAMLDALMGPGRDVLDKGPKNEKFKESSVCKSFLVGFCPLDSSMLGGKRKFDVCSRIHSDLMRDQLNAHPDAEKLKREYQTLFLRDLEHVARECDGHIANERQRIREDVRKKKAPLPVDVNARLSAMKREAEGLVAQAKALDDDRLRDKESLEARAKEIMADRESYMEVETKKAADAVVPEEVCEVCGTAYEGPQEKENHKKFKVHKVYEKVRDMIPELKKTVDELAPVPPSLRVHVNLGDMQSAVSSEQPAAQEKTEDTELPKSEDEAEEVPDMIQSEPGAQVGTLARMGTHMSVTSQRSIMGGVQRRIKLLEEMSNPESKTLQYMSESSSKAGERGADFTLGLPLLITLLVCFVAVSTGGGMLVVLGVYLDREAPLTSDDIRGLWATCLGVFGASTVASLVIGLVVGRLLARQLRGVVKLMDCVNRTAQVDCKAKDLQRMGRRSKICEVKHLQAASSHLLYSIEVFKRYLPETVVRDIVQGVDRARRLHVARRQVTIMFSDIRDFTTISETLSHHNLLLLLTRYLSTMTRIVDAYEGVVAEILGDGLLVFWNTPDDVRQHAAKACAAALSQCEALETLNEEFDSMGLPKLAIRVGLHTGTVLTGNIGSERKMKFGCMGDPVNLASRLEGLCKNYGVSVLCSEATHNELPEDNCFCTRQMDLVQVKGKNEPTRIYEVIGLNTSGEQEDVNEDNSDSEDDRGRRMRSFHAVAKEAVSRSAEALGEMQMRQENPFVRLLKKTKKRMSQSSEGPQKNTEQMLRTSSGVSSIATADIEGSFTDFARGVSQMSRVSARSRMTTPQVRAHAARYEQALQSYQEARFPEARDLAMQCLADVPGDIAARRLLERTSRYIGPNDEIVGLSLEELKAWTGVTVMTEK